MSFTVSYTGDVLRNPRGKKINLTKSNTEEKSLRHVAMVANFLGSVVRSGVNRNRNFFCVVQTPVISNLGTMG